MVRENRERPSFGVMQKMPRRQIHGQELSVIGAVARFRVFQLPAEETRGLPGAIPGLLLEYGSDRLVGSVCHDSKRCALNRMSKESSLS